MQRRSLLKLTAGLVGAHVASPVLWATGPTKKVLVLGGTGFLGPATVQSLLDRGHTVTLFNRGISSPELFPTLEKLRGDREPARQNLAALQTSRRWDAVIDVWPQEPALAEATARLLAPRTYHYR